MSHVCFNRGECAILSVAMSGHSKWSTIKRQKGVKDAQKGAVFTKLGNMLAIAARSGDDPDTNFALRLAVDKAKAASMPHANIQRAIDRGSGKLGGAVIEEVTYEGYAPGGVGVIVECATDNKNRTYPEVRLAFSKNGGNIAESGAVAFQFQRKGVIRIDFEGDPDEATLAAIDAGAEDAEVEDGELIIYTDPKQLAAVRDKLQQDSNLRVQDAELTYVPQNIVEIDDPETERKLMNLMDALDSLDDVTNVHANFVIKDRE